MHTEKNVFEKIINTVMNVKEKTKDNLNARRTCLLIASVEDLTSESLKMVKEASEKLCHKMHMF